MSKIPSRNFQMESWATVFSIFSFINFWIVYIWHIYQSLGKRTWLQFFFFHPKESCTLFEILIFLGRAPTSICHFFRPSVHRAPYPKNRTSSNHSFWYSCVKWYLQVSFFFFVVSFVVVFFWRFWFFGLLGR